MAGFIDIARAALSDDLKLRVQTACFVVARNYIAGPAATTPQAELRLRLARTIVADPAARVSLLAWAVATTPSIASTITVVNNVVTVAATDAAIQAVVESAWDTVAGWTPY